MKENLKRADLQAEREHTTKLVGIILKPITEVTATVTTLTTGSKALQMATSGFNMLSQTVKEMLQFSMFHVQFHLKRSSFLKIERNPEVILMKM